MAKINANGARKLQGVRVDLPNDGNWMQRQRYVLRSDGKVLHAYQIATHYPGQSDYWGSLNYYVLGRVADPASFDLVRFATRKHPDALKVTADF
jgi:hypothetical protein